MKFPEKHTCHNGRQMFTAKGEWRQPKDSGSGSHTNDVYRSCDYCGSIHPEDLIAASKLPGFKMSGADWKYGHPHKAYLDIPSPFAGKPRKMGSRSEMKDGVRTETDFIEPAPAMLHGKWYTEHLLDDGYDLEAQLALFAVIEQYMGIRFSFNDAGQLMYQRITGAKELGER